MENEKMITMNVSPSDSIMKIKKNVADAELIPTDRFNLIYQIRELNVDKTVGDYNIQESATLYCVQKKW